MTYVPFASDDAVMKTRGSVVTDHAHHGLFLFVGFLHLVVSVDGRGFVFTVGTGHRPLGSRVGR